MTEVSEFNPSESDYVYHYRDYIQHIQWLMEGMCFVQTAIMHRLLTHDRTKIEPPELEAYAEVVPAFKGLVFGSEEHIANGKRLGPAWKHHTEHNLHHPEHHPDGIDGMTLIDLIEMVCDWRAAALRRGSFDVEQSLNVLRDRHGISPQLENVIRNTGRWLAEECKVLPSSQVEEQQKS